MAVSSPASFLVSMGVLKFVLLMLMSSSCSIAAYGNVVPRAPGRINARGHARSADHQHATSSLSKGDAAEHASTHRRHNQNGVPGVRFDMTRRSPSCAELSMLQGVESRSRHIACAVERSARRLSLMAGKKAKAEQFSSDTKDMEGVSGAASFDWKFPESAGAGEFLVPIYLGTPPVKARIVIDTGSDLTWIQSQPCSDCYEQVDPIFDTSKSSTYKKLACSSSMCDELKSKAKCLSGSCRYTYNYGHSITLGNFSTERLTVDLTMGGKSEVTLHFGASDLSRGFFAENKEIEGVFGLGQGAISLPSQLGAAFGKKFSYCLVHWLSKETSTLYLGDAAIPEGEVQYTPILPNAKFPSFYYIRVMGISVGSTLLPIDQSVFEIDSSGQGGTIIDTGFAVSIFLPKAYDQIIVAYKSQVKYPISTTSMTGLELCFDMAGVTNPSFPTMEIHLDGAQLSLPTPNSFVTIPGVKDLTCLAIVPNRDPQVLQANFLGNIQQQNFDIVYDLKDKVIGFMPADCASV